MLVAGIIAYARRKFFEEPAQAEFSVYTEDRDIRFPLEKNRSYLLFAYRRYARLEIDSCGNSGSLAKAAESIRSIEAIPHALPFGIIEGWMAPETDGIDVSGVRVTVNSSSRNYTAITNKDGWFHFRAPAGAYKVDFRSGDYHLNTDITFCMTHTNSSFMQEKPLHFKSFRCGTWFDNSFHLITGHQVAHTRVSANGL
jgi:hypothetical protein